MVVQIFSMYPNNLHVHPVAGGLQFAFAEYDYSVEVALDMIIMIVDKLADGPLKRSLISQMCIYFVEVNCLYKTRLMYMKFENTK